MKTECDVVVNLKQQISNLEEELRLLKKSKLAIHKILLKRGGLDTREVVITEMYDTLQGKVIFVTEED